ncbi:hypothetical protein F2Q69_00014734 [Brassica cretica]|uniref:Uncharacterized protein n=1 Tax=Brassica cretica TaxID=69181 RepID=A0A8S9R0I5_BRACR|nr:hypothetical protein F2Q69_00014734 [Brassica cretica]
MWCLVKLAVVCFLVHLPLPAGRDDDTSGPKPCVRFDTPRLVYMEYSDKYEILRLDSLVEVRLHLLLTADQIMRKKTPESVGFVHGDQERQDPLLI